MIQFLGPRSKLDKGVGMYASAASHGDAASAAGTVQSDKKAISKFCELEFADVPAERWARLIISEEEMEIINSGTNDITSDWRNIRLWAQWAGQGSPSSAHLLFQLDYLKQKTPCGETIFKDGR